MKYVIGFVVVMAVLIAGYVSVYNQAVRMEQALTAQYEDNQNILAQYGQKVLEAAQVTTAYKQSVLDVVEKAMTGRYGSEGSKSVFNWIQEDNPEIDPATFVKVQQIIESGRTDFERGQRRMIDLRRNYQTSLNSVVTGTIMRIAGFPKVDLKKFDPILTQRTEDVYKAGRENGPINVFGGK